MRRHSLGFASMAIATLSLQRGMQQVSRLNCRRQQALCPEDLGQGRGKGRAREADIDARDLGLEIGTTDTSAAEAETGALACSYKPL